MSILNDIKSHVPRSVASQIWDDVPEQKDVQPTAHKPFVAPFVPPPVPFREHAAPIPYTPDTGAPASVVTDPSGIDTFKAMLKAKTDFDSTDVGKQVLDHLVPLDGLPLNENQKMTAVLKAGSKEGLTGDKIITTLQGLLVVLRGEQDQFQGSVTAMTKEQIGSRQQQITDTAAHITDLEGQLASARESQNKLSADLIEAQTKIQTKQSQFQAAADSIRTEIQARIDHYSEVLKGNQ